MNDKGLHTYSFQTNLVIDAHTREQAEVLLKQLLDTAGFSRYHINKGSLIGASIVDGSSAKLPSTTAPAPESSSPAAPGGNELHNLAPDMIRRCAEDGRLVRLNINRGKGVKLSVPCRIVNWDEQKGLLTVYHVDEKQVYTFGIGEIDDFIV